MSRKLFELTINGLSLKNNQTTPADGNICTFSTFSDQLVSPLPFPLTQITRQESVRGLESVPLSHQTFWWRTQIYMKENAQPEVSYSQLQAV